MKPGALQCSHPAISQISASGCVGEDGRGSCDPHPLEMPISDKHYKKGLNGYSSSNIKYEQLN